VEAARMQVQLVQQHFARDETTFPELALFNSAEQAVMAVDAIPEAFVACLSVN
jgi:hypothetical protein